MVHMPTCISGDAYQILDSKKNLYCAKFLSTRQIHVIENYGLKMRMYIFSTTFWNFKQMYFIPNPEVHYRFMFSHVLVLQRFMLYLILGSNTDSSHTEWVKIVLFKLQINSCHSIKHFLADSHIWWLKQTTDSEIDCLQYQGSEFNHCEIRKTLRFLLCQSGFQGPRQIPVIQVSMLQ